MRHSLVATLLAAAPSTLAAPKQPPISNTTALPTHFGMLLFPHFQALDVFGPMDVLNTLFLVYGNTTVPTRLSILSKTLDPVSTLMKGMHGSGDFGQAVVPTITFKDYLAKHEKGQEKIVSKGETLYQENTYDQGGRYLIGDDQKKRQHGTMPPHDKDPEKDWGEIEVLFVPGGGGTRQNMTEEIDFVKRLYPKLKYIVSVCTGATILARAGVLDGKRATTNKRAWAWATSTGPNVNWVPTARWVEDGNIISSSGISAGIDGTYAFVSRVYGEEVANYIALASEYARETDWRHDPWSKVWDVPGATE